MHSVLLVHLSYAPLSDCDLCYANNLLPFVLVYSSHFKKYLKIPSLNLLPVYFKRRKQIQKMMWTLMKSLMIILQIVEFSSNSCMLVAYGSFSHRQGFFMVTFFNHFLKQPHRNLYNQCPMIVNSLLHCINMLQVLQIGVFLRWVSYDIFDQTELWSMLGIWGLWTWE